MNSLLATVIVLALGQGGAHEMRPHVLQGDTSHCDAVMVRDTHIVLERVCIKGSGNPKPPFRAEVTWDGQVATISESDEKASAAWIRTHSLLKRLSVKHSNLYWDGKKVDLGKVNVFRVYLAFPWQGGVLIYGATTPAKVSLAPGHIRVLSSMFGKWSRSVQSSSTPTR